MKYVFKNEPLTIHNLAQADPQLIGETLEALARDAGGDLRPQAVVNAARAPDHVLHRHFDWNDKLAAEKYRLDQARAIIRCIRAETDDDEEPVRAFLSISDRGGVSYRTVSEVKSSTDLQLAVLKQAERDLLAFETRYRDLQDICKLIRSAKAKVRKRREKLETRPNA